MKITPEQFEALLDRLCSELQSRIEENGAFTSSKDFEGQVRTQLEIILSGSGLAVNFSPHPHIFPDIVLPPYGIEVKFTEKDTWRSVANSVFESTRSPEVDKIYLLFGKMGGIPAVKWGHYGDCVVHVRTSHVPRFEVEIESERSLFQIVGISYDEFSQLDVAEKMKHVREYARNRLKPGERLWWIDTESDSNHSLPIQARLYTSLEQEEKRRLRAEAALLCPIIVSPSRSRGKYDDVTLYLLTYRGVLASLVRDLFSAGSVALRSDDTRGGNYLLRALKDIEEEMLKAASDLPDVLFEEYWGESCPSPTERINRWLIKADALAVDWRPSDELFRQ